VASEIFKVMEEGYKRQWEAWHGYMVDTGATREAWTNSNAPGAIRGKAGYQTFHFGSTIYYNKYHAKTLIEPGERMSAEIVKALGDYYVSVTPAFRKKKKALKLRPPTVPTGTGGTATSSSNTQKPRVPNVRPRDAKGRFKKKTP